MKFLVTAVFMASTFLVAGQNVGIGVSSPNAKLSVGTGSELTGSAMSNAFRVNAGVLGNTAGNEVKLANVGFIAGTNHTALGIRGYRVANGTDYTTSAILLEYDVDNTTRPSGGFLAISNNGRVGINNANPATPLDVGGGNWDVVGGEGDFRIGSDAYRLKMGIATSGGGAGAASIMVQGQNGAYNVLSLGSQGNKILHVNGALNAVGIGTDYPAGKLDIASTSSTPQLLISQGSTSDFGRIRIKNGNTAGNNRIWDIAGFISGTTADGDRLNFFNTTGSNVLGLAGNGAIYVNGLSGTAGQTIRSGGPGAAASWSNEGNAFYQFTGTDVQNDLIGINGSTTVGGVDGQSITVTRTSAVIVTCKLSVYNMYNVNGVNATAILKVYFRNAGGTIALEGSTERIANGAQANITCHLMVDNVSPGNYSFDVMFEKGAGDDIGTGSNYQSAGTTNAKMVVQVIPK